MAAADVVRREAFVDEDEPGPVLVRRELDRDQRRLPPGDGRGPREDEAPAGLEDAVLAAMLDVAVAAHDDAEATADADVGLDDRRRHVARTHEQAERLGSGPGCVDLRRGGGQDTLDDDALGGFVRNGSGLSMRHAALHEDGFEGIEPPLPNAALRGDPLRDGDEPVCLEGEAMLAARDRAPHEAGLLEDPDVLRDGGERHVERRRQIGDARVAVGEATEDRPPGWIRKGKEGAVQHLFVRTWHRDALVARAAYSVNPLV